MKDNYSWLNDLMGWYERDGETWQPKSWEMSEDLNVTNVKQTIISQIEIEKLRAEGFELLNMPFNDNRFDFEWLHEHWAKRIDNIEADLTEKLKESEK
jgi:hypothetical protein